jgi:DNA polymerase-1
MNFLLGLQHLDTIQDAEVVAFDCETTQLQPEEGKMRLLQLATHSRPPVVIDCWDLDETGWTRLRQFFGEDRKWVAHNAVFDLGWLQAHDIYPAGMVFCTMLASRVLTNGMILPKSPHTLQAVVKRYLKKEISKEEQRSDWSAELSMSQLEYGANDVRVLMELYNPIQQMMATGSLHKAWMLECIALPAMASLWRNGLPFDKELLLQLQEDLWEEQVALGEQFIQDLDEALPAEHKLPRDADGSLNLRAKAEGSVRAGTKKEAGFNINSPAQLRQKFTVLLGQVPVSEKTQKPSVDRVTMQQYAADHAVIRTYLKWKKVEKRRQMVETLINHLSPDGYIRASYMQAGADTFRMSCRNPNLQQVPRDPRFRICVQAPAGWKMVVADFAQMELRLAAAEAQDELMIQAFQDGLDLHTLTAMEIYDVPEEAVTKEQRQIAKSANFGLLYGSGARGLRQYAAGMGIEMDLDEAREVREKFHAAYKGICAWQRRAAAAADSTKGVGEVRVRVSNLRRFLPGEHNKLTTRCNTPIQAAGAAVLKRTLGKLWPLLHQAGEEQVRLSGVVHDEIILMTKEEVAEEWAEILQQQMEAAEAEWLGDVPALAEAHVGNSWLEAK